MDKHMKPHPRPPATPNTACAPFERDVHTAKKHLDSAKTPAQMTEGKLKLDTAM